MVLFCCTYRRMCFIQEYIDSILLRALYLSSSFASFSGKFSIRFSIISKHSASNVQSWHFSGWEGQVFVLKSLSAELHKAQLIQCDAIFEFSMQCKPYVVFKYRFAFSKNVFLCLLLYLHLWRLWQHSVTEINPFMPSHVVSSRPASECCWLGLIDLRIFQSEESDKTD